MMDNVRICTYGGVELVERLDGVDGHGKNKDEKYKRCSGGIVGVGMRDHREIARTLYIRPIARYDAIALYQHITWLSSEYDELAAN